MKWYQIRWQFILILVLIIGPLVGAYFYYRLPTGDGLSQIDVPDAPFNREWSKRKILLLGMGDSIVTGFGASGKKFGFFEMLTDNPYQDYPDMNNKTLRRVFSQIEKKNIAENSTTSGDHIRQIELLPKQPEEVFGIVVISTGGIDLIHDYGRSAPRDEAIYGATREKIPDYARLFEARLQKLLGKIKAKFPGGVKIFIFSIYDPTDGVGDIENVHPLLKILKKLPKWPDGLYALNLWNTIIKKAAIELDYVVLVDIHQAFLGHGLHCNDKANPYFKPQNPYYWYYINLEDPNKTGYDAIRRLVLLKMIEVFNKN